MSQDSLAHKKFRVSQRRKRTRSQGRGSAERPRLSVSISQKHVSAQIIDDGAGRTLIHATTVGKRGEGTLTDRASSVGSEIAKRAQKAKIKKVVFDRGERKYHGRIKAMAEAARAGGLEF